MGTAGYMSPEQVRLQPVDQRSDIFAFGCVLYELLSGRPAFSAESLADTISAILSRDPPPLTGGDRPVSPALAAIVEKCLEKRPEERFHSAHDLGLALAAFSDVAATPASSSEAGRQARWPLRAGEDAQASVVATSAASAAARTR